MQPLTGEPAHGSSADGPGGDPAESRRVELRETYRKQLLAGIGGWTGTVITAIPPVVFVVVNAISTLRTAIIAAVATALALAAYRVVRKQPTQQAISGLFGVVIAAFIAGRTGQARGYFLLGIWTSLLYAVPFAISLLVRRPLVGLLWEFLDPTPGGEGTAWYRRKPLLRAYDLATLAATVVFLARGLVQWKLYGDNATGWLAFARVAMGYPLWIAAVGFSFLIVRRARAQLAVAPTVGPGARGGDERADAIGTASTDDGAADGSLGLG
ncbi:MAG: DUF3159 domain-containing protein [Jatrophihabitantaceae bacterium]